MTAQEIFDLIKDIKPGVWKIGVTYKKDLPILKGRGKNPSPAEQAGIYPGDLYKVVYRWCSANVNRSNTKAYAARQADKTEKIANGEQVRDVPSGFHKSDNADELNIIEYKDGTNDPCLILKKGPHADKVKYFNKDQEITLQDVQDLIAQKIVSKTALNELAPNEVFNLYPDKVQSLKIDGILHEELDTMNEARFNGIALPNEDGFYDMDEELCEDNNSAQGNCTTSAHDALMPDPDSPEESARKTADYFKQQQQMDKKLAKQCAADADAGDPGALVFRNKFLQNKKNIGEDLSVKQTKQKVVITEAMEHAARKNGYRNYTEYMAENK